VRLLVSGDTQVDKRVRGFDGGGAKEVLGGFVMSSRGVQGSTQQIFRLPVSGRDFRRVAPQTYVVLPVANLAISNRCQRHEDYDTAAGSTALGRWRSAAQSETPQQVIRKRPMKETYA